MSLNIKCRCGKTLRAGDHLAGKYAKCPFCKTRIPVPKRGELLAMQIVSEARDEDSPHSLLGLVSNLRNELDEMDLGTLEREFAGVRQEIQAIRAQTGTLT